MSKSEMQPRRKQTYECPCAVCAAARAVIVKDPFNRHPARTGMNQAASKRHPAVKAFRRRGP